MQPKNNLDPTGALTLLQACAIGVVVGATGLALAIAFTLATGGVAAVAAAYGYSSVAAAVVKSCIGGAAAEAFARILGAA
jgi:hypothetical protein